MWPSDRPHYASCSSVPSVLFVLSSRNSKTRKCKKTKVSVNVLRHMSNGVPIFSLRGQSLRSPDVKNLTKMMHDNWTDGRTLCRHSALTSCSLLSVTTGTKDLWPYLILLQAMPALLSLLVLPFVPDTPRYLLLVRGDRDNAISCMQCVRLH